MCGALLVNYCAVVRFFHFFVPSFMCILDLSAISLQESDICESFYQCYDYSSYCSKLQAGNAQEKSTMLNRPIKVVPGCINWNCSYIFQEVHVRLDFTLQYIFPAEA